MKCAGRGFTHCHENGFPIPKASYNWAVLITRIYETLPLVCPRCQGPMKVIAFIEEPQAIVKILLHMGESTERPISSPARGPPEWEDEPYPEDYIHEYPDEHPIINL